MQYIESPAPGVFGSSVKRLGYRSIFPEYFPRHPVSQSSPPIRTRYTSKLSHIPCHVSHEAGRGGRSGDGAMISMGLSVSTEQRVSIAQLDGDQGGRSERIRPHPPPWSSSKSHVYRECWLYIVMCRRQLLRAEDGSVGMPL